MKIPKVGSKIKVRTTYKQGAAMFPPRDTYRQYEGEVLPSHKWLSDREFCMSGDARWPIRVINMNAVEQLDLISGGFIEINNKPKTVVVKGSKGATYTVSNSGKGWNCTCTGFQFRKKCKHILEVD
jgi:hypothetical protein